VAGEEAGMKQEDTRAFAEQWATAWNERAVERVLAHFRDDVIFTSPTAQTVMGKATLRGKEALREYWNNALARIGSLRFTVDRVLWDASSRELVIIYVSELNGRRKRVSENLRFDVEGLVESAEVFHGAEELGE